MPNETEICPICGELKHKLLPCPGCLNFKSMKNTILFSLIFCAFCTFAPFSALLTGCNKVEAINPIDMTWQDSVILIGEIPYMMTLEGNIPIIRVENAHNTYSYFMDMARQNQTESPEIWMYDWSDSSHVLVEYLGKFYYTTIEYIGNSIQGVLTSEFDYPIYICYRDEIFVGADYWLNMSCISEPLQTYCKTLESFEAHIRPTDNPSEFQIYFGGWDAKKGEYTYFKSFIVIT